MANTVNLDDYEKINFLFKNYLGFPNTDKSKPFFLETTVKANNYLFGAEIFLDEIPISPDFDVTNTSTELNINALKLNATDSAIHTDSTGIIRRFTKIKLQKINGTQRGYYCLDQNGVNILKDALQFNVNKKDDGTQPYLYKLYTNSGVNNNERILEGTKGGNWIFDVKNGVVNFPDSITGYNVSENSPPYLTFYKYVGRKGLNQLSTTDITGLQSSTNNSNFKIEDLSGNLLDLSKNTFSNIQELTSDLNDVSQNTYKKSYIDASFNNIYTKSIIDDKFTTLESDIDASFNDVYNIKFIDDLNSTLRNYVDGVVSGLDIKESVRAATVDASNVDTSGLYNTSNALIVDGIIINNGNRILLKNQNNKVENGIYELSGNKLFRTADFKNSNTVTYGAFTFVELGNINNDKGFVLTKTNNSPDEIVIGNTELDFSQFSGAGQIVAGDGLNKNGEILSVNIDNSTLSIINDTLQIHDKFSNNLDASFNDVYTKATIDNKLSALQTNVDASFNNLESDIDSSFNDVYTKAAIDNSFNILDKNVVDLSNNLYSKTNIDFKISNIQLNDISNVNIETVQNEQYLKYDSSTLKWVPSTISIPKAEINNSKQTFFEILTQQPNKFTAESTAVSSSQITINWNYDDIIPINNSRLMFPLAESGRSLPYIEQLYFDLSGVNTYNANNSETWVNDNSSTITIPSTANYNNGNTYKVKIFPKTPLNQADDSDIKNILSKATPIDIRVYGIANNNETNYPDINTRALVFQGITFPEVSAPSKPFRNATEVLFPNSLTVNYKVDQTEKGVIDSSARLYSIQGKYQELSGADTLVSSIITQDTTEKTKILPLNLLNAGEKIPITIDKLRNGTKYKYKASVQNNFSTTYSDDSDLFTTSNYTSLPIPGSSNIDFSIHPDCIANILTSYNSTVHSNAVYLNIAGTTDLKFNNTNLQTFELTDMSGTILSSNGIGKGVDDKNDIVKIEINMTYSQDPFITNLHIIKFGGYDTATKAVKTIDHHINTPTVFVTNISCNDKYNENNLSKGFRINGSFKLTNIPKSKIEDVFGTPSGKPSIKLATKYIRSYNTEKNIDIETTIFVDNFFRDPFIVKGNVTFNITDTIYTMGIPSVKLFNATFKRTYQNINSEVGLIPANGKIGEITSINETNITSPVPVTMTYNEIDVETREVQKDTTIYGLFYNTNTVLSNSKIFEVKEKAFSLKQPNGYPSDGDTSTIITEHFCDRLSYNLNNGQIYTRKFNTTFYEIANINDLDNNLGTMTVTQYSDTTHKTSIKPWTLLFINGSIQTNAAQNYPNFSNSRFNQTGIDTPISYSNGTSSYDLTGNNTDTNNGYKWIVFKLPSNSSTYIKQATSKTGGAPLPYIDIPTFIDSLPFNSVSDIKGKINTGFGGMNVIGFIRITKSNDVVCIGRFTSNKVANNLWYGGANNSAASITNVLSNTGTGQVYGTLIDTGNYTVDNGWGVECPTQSNFKSGSNIEIFIGLKNSISL